jgi:hypothetical protein
LATIFPSGPIRKTPARIGQSSPNSIGRPKLARNGYCEDHGSSAKLVCGHGNSLGAQQMGQLPSTSKAAKPSPNLGLANK